MYLSASIRRQRMRLAPGRGLIYTETYETSRNFFFLFLFLFVLFIWMRALSCSGTGLMMPPPLLTINNIALILYLHARTLHTFTETSECSFFSPLSFLLFSFIYFSFFFLLLFRLIRERATATTTKKKWAIAVDSQKVVQRLLSFLITGSYQSLPLISSSWVV